MAIFSSLASFFRRHKRKLIITTTLTVSAYFVINHFIFKKLRDFQKSLKQELFIKEQIKRRFIQTQNDCHSTVLSLLPVLTQPITDYLPIESITNALKLRKSNSNNNQEMSDSLLTANNLLLHSNENMNNETSYINKSKVELWNDLKIKTLTRTLTLIHSISGLLLLTRLQLNILARRSYLELAIVMAGGKVEASNDQYNDYLIEQAYLSLSWWLLNNGWIKLSDNIESLIIKKFENLNAKSQLSISQFELILNEINQEVLNSNILGLLFPLNYDHLIETLLNTNPQLVNELDDSNSNLLKLINETNLLISNDFFQEIYSKLISSSTNTLISNLFFNLDHDSFVLHQQNQVTNDKKFKLANFLAQLSIQCGIICDNNHFAQYDHHELTGNIYINTLNDLDDLEEFSASIYSNFE
ncbi:Peroxin-3 [Hyphopichia burtonii NRRL Y-1933]|uniref:Peroxin-3 n=1 Tax=Hyphopichia burtonii NRRL Y-1933 TaxID=984485 RepID=A0A1E4RCB7_9ASCO|nr:Peroxin-3 [Hyphopichia burtonii NRRL Y-1933]ODV64890.1 Peroxin-3 [Hyphopichia burtonii NRRL Y-1933]